MATWNELRAHARAALLPDSDDEEAFALTVHLERDGLARAQRVLVRHYGAWGRSMIELRSAFGKADEHDAEQLLAENLKLPLGAVALHGDVLVLTHRACLEDLAVEGAVFLMLRLGELADTLEAANGRDRF